MFLKMLADCNSFLDQVIQVFWKRWGQTWRKQYIQYVPSVTSIHSDKTNVTFHNMIPNTDQDTSLTLPPVFYQITLLDTSTFSDNT